MESQDIAIDMENNLKIGNFRKREKEQGGGTCNFYGDSVAGVSDTTNSSSSHGAVRVEGVLHMYGGGITHNRSGCGGGVNVCSMANHDAYFYLHGGSISSNYANFDDGGGIHCYDTGQSSDNIKLAGGTITGNTTGGDTGGGIKCDDVVRPLTVSGGIRITGNKNKAGKESNLHLCDNMFLHIGSSGLESNAVIGITTATQPTLENSIPITMAYAENYKAYFKSDNSDYAIEDSMRNQKHQVQLAYQSNEEKVARAKETVKKALVDTEASNSTTEQEIQSVIDTALSEAGLMDVSVTVKGFTKTDATTSEAGSIRGEIVISCGEETDSVAIDKTIPATGTKPDRGAVDKDVQTDGKAPDTKISTSVDELTKILLTDEEKKQVADGTDIKIILDVKDALDSVSSGDRELVENMLKTSTGAGFTAPHYIDIRLFKVIGDSRSAISETKEALTITMKVPDSLRNTDNKG